MSCGMNETAILKEKQNMSLEYLEVKCNYLKELANRMLKFKQTMKTKRSFYKALPKPKDENIQIDIKW